MTRDFFTITYLRFAVFTQAWTGAASRPTVPRKPREACGPPVYEVFPASEVYKGHQYLRRGSEILGFGGKKQGDIFLFGLSLCHCCLLLCSSHVYHNTANTYRTFMDILVHVPLRNISTLNAAISFITLQHDLNNPSMFPLRRNQSGSWDLLFS